MIQTSIRLKQPKVEKTVGKELKSEATVEQSRLIVARAVNVFFALSPGSLVVYIAIVRAMTGDIISGVFAVSTLSNKRRSLSEWQIGSSYI